MNEFIRVVDKGRERSLAVKDELSGVEDRLGAAAGHKVHVLDLTGLHSLHSLVELLDLILVHV